MRILSKAKITKSLFQIARIETLGSVSDVLHHRDRHSEPSILYRQSSSIIVQV